MGTKKCGLCGSRHGEKSSCLLPKAKAYAWGYEWLGREGHSAQVCWVVPVRGEEEAQLVVRFFHFAQDFRRAGWADVEPSKVHPSEALYRWAPDILDEARRWREEGEPRPPASA